MGFLTLRSSSMKPLSRILFKPFVLYLDNRIIVLTNGFAKKTQKTPSQEIHLAEQRKRDYLRRNLNYD